MNVQTNYIRCALCSLDDTEILCDQVGLKRGAPLNVSTVICNRCGLIYQNPMPTKDFLKNFYKRGAYVNDKGGEQYIKNKIERKKLNPESDLSLHAARFVSEHAHRESHVLDIGCGWGTLLLEINRQTGCKITGIEPDHTYASLARDHGVRDLKEMFLDEFIQISKEKFDLITMRHLFEHLPDPNAEIENLKSLLKDDGYLFIEVPDVSNMDPSPSLRNYFVLGHVYHYSPYSLSQMLLKHGMKVIKFASQLKNGSHAMLMVATRFDNPVDSVPFHEFKSGSNIKAIKRQFRMVYASHIFHRLKRKTKTLLKGKWKINS